MKRIPTFLLVALAAGAGAAIAAGASATDSPLISKMAHGEVAIVPEPMMNGELVFKVVAVNRTLQVVRFGPEDIHIHTASGKPVGLMSLDQLTAQVVRANGGAAPAISYNAVGAAGPAVTYGKNGQPNLQNLSGGGTMGPEIIPQTARVAAPSAAAKKQIAQLRRSILQSTLVGPDALQGGEVVSQPVSFGFFESRKVRVDVQFNGDKHEFTFVPPPAK